MNLELHQYYTRDEVFDAFAKAKPTEAEGWFLSSRRLVGLFEIGERPPDIHFCDNSRFHWYARKDETVPKPIQDFKKLKGGYIFIRSPTDDRYAYVSNIAHVGMYGTGPDGCEATMDIDPHVPTALLHQLGGLYLHPDGDDAMNQPVAALLTAKTPDDCFGAFQRFVQNWRGPIEERHGLSDTDIAGSQLPVPRLLEKLYRWAGACDDIMHAGYMSIRKPAELSVDDADFVAFCVECQWCGNYYVRRDALHEADPEVYADECGDTRNGAGYHGTGIGLSKFFWAYYIAFNGDGGPLSYQIDVTDDEVQRIKGTVDPLPVLAHGSQSCRAIQAYRSDIRASEEALVFAKDGVMGHLVCESNFNSMMLRSKSEAAIDRFVSAINVDPERLHET